MTSTLKVDELQNSLGGSDVKVGSLKHPDASGTNITLGSDGSATIGQISSSSVFPAGHVIQTVSDTHAPSSATSRTGSVNLRPVLPLSGLLALRGAVVVAAPSLAATTSRAALRWQPLSRWHPSRAAARRRRF